MNQAGIPRRLFEGYLKTVCTKFSGSLLSKRLPESINFNKIQGCWRLLFQPYHLIFPIPRQNQIQHNRHNAAGSNRVAEHFR